jgi:hypothetical protein
MDVAEGVLLVTCWTVALGVLAFVADWCERRFA